MRRVAATTSWGVGLVLIIALPVTALAQTPPVTPVLPPAPQTPAATQKPATPAPPPNLYERSWDATLDLTAPARLVATGHTALVTGARRSTTSDRATRLVAFDLGDGKERWRLDLSNVTVLAADDDRTIVGLDDRLAAYDTATGAPRWAVSTLGGPMVVVDRSGWVVVTRGSEVAALRATDGTTVWRETIGPDVVGSPAIDGDGVFLLTSDGRLLRMAITSGEVQWAIDLDAEAREVLAANDRLYVSLSDGRLMVYRQPDGRSVWKYQFSAQAIGAGISDLRHVYLSLGDNTVQAIDRDIGNQRWKAPLPERPAAAPLLTADVVLMPLKSGEVDIASAKDGRMLGKIAAPSPPDGAPGATPQLLALVVAPGDTILRIVVADDTSPLTLTALRRPPPAKKK